MRKQYLAKTCFLPISLNKDYCLEKKLSLFLLEKQWLTLSFNASQNEMTMRKTLQEKGEKMV